MTLGIIVPLVVLPIALVVFWRWYHRAFRSPITDAPPVISGVRLTADSLHRLASPPWRVVHEIGDRVAGIDHIVVAPAGVVAIHTSAVDRPTLGQLTEHRTTASLVAESAIARSGVDDLLGGTPVTCGLLARVFWGRADPNRPSAEEWVHATPLVEGQRLVEWLEDWNANAPAVLDAATVEHAWRTLVTGIGRPDPRS